MSKAYNEVMGNLNTTGDVIIYGDVMGSVNCSGNCTVKGDVHGDINARSFDEQQIAERAGSLLEKASSKLHEIKDSVTNSNIQINSGGKSIQVCNGRVITSGNGVITINGKKYNGTNVTVINNKVYIDGVCVDEE